MVEEILLRVWFRVDSVLSFKVFVGWCISMFFVILVNSYEFSSMVGEYVIVYICGVFLVVCYVYIIWLLFYLLGNIKIVI